MLEEPLKQHRRLREPSKSRARSGVVPEEEKEEGEQAARKVSRRKAGVEERRSPDASGSKRVCLEQRCHASSPRTPPAEAASREAVASGEAEEAIDVESLSPSGAGGPQEGEADRKETGRREADAEEPEHSSGDEIVVVDGDDGDDGDADALRRSSLVTHQMSAHRSESFICQSEEEEEEIDVVGEPSLHPRSAVCAAAT